MLNAKGFPRKSVKTGSVCENPLVGEKTSSPNTYPNISLNSCQMYFQIDFYLPPKSLQPKRIRIRKMIRNFFLKIWHFFRCFDTLLGRDFQDRMFYCSAAKKDEVLSRDQLTIAGVESMELSIPLPESKIVVTYCLQYQDEFCFIAFLDVFSTKMVTKKHKKIRNPNPPSLFKKNS